MQELRFLSHISAEDQLFKEKLSHVLGSSYQFVPLRSGSAQDRKTLMIPTKDLDIPFTEMEQFNFEQDCQFSLPSYKPNDDIFHSVIHVALKIQEDLNEHRNHQWYNISEKTST